MAYCTKADLKTYLSVGNTTDDSLLARLITRAEQAINAYCRRSFEATTATRYYRIDRVVGSVLHLDADLQSVTSLTNGNEQAIPAGGYWLEPRNTPPYAAIRLKSSYAWVFNTDGEVAVTGTWGFSQTAPEDITHACIRLAAYFYRQKDTPVFDVTAQPDMGVLTVPQGMPADVRLLLASYRRSGQ